MCLTFLAKGSRKTSIKLFLDGNLTLGAASDVVRLNEAQLCDGRFYGHSRCDCNLHRCDVKGVVTGSRRQKLERLTEGTHPPPFLQENLLFYLFMFGQSLENNETATVLIVWHALHPVHQFPNLEVNLTPLSGLGIKKHLNKKCIMRHSKQHAERTISAAPK